MNEQIELLAKLLEEHRLVCAFGIAGSGSSLALITELEHRGIPYYPASHEASAAIMAGTVFKVTGRLAASISIKGPGVANMIPGITHNHFESNAVISIAEAFGSHVPSYRKHKRLCHADMLKAIVTEHLFVNELEASLPTALKAAQREVPGPVHLDLCPRPGASRVENHEADPDAPVPKADALEAMVRRIAMAERPILICGSLALRRKWRHSLPHMNVPFFTTASAKGALDEALPQSAGVFTGDGKELAPERHLFEKADLVVGIGLRNTEVLSPKPFGKPTIIIDEVDNQLADGFGADALCTRADSDSVSMLFDALRDRSWGLEDLASLRESMKKSLLTDPWLPAVCFQRLNELSFPYLMILDTGAFCTIGEHIWHAGPDRGFVGSSNGRYMGVAIPSAVGAAIGRAGVPVVCVFGDGGMRTYPAEIKLAVAEQLPICFLLMTDGRYGSIAGVAQSKPMSRRAVTIPEPSWWKSVQAMGCEAAAVDAEPAYVKALEGWSRRGPLFIEATFDAERYSGMTARLR